MASYIKKLTIMKRDSTNVAEFNRLCNLIIERGESISGAETYFTTHSKDDLVFDPNLPFLTGMLHFKNEADEPKVAYSESIVNVPHIVGTPCVIVYNNIEIRPLAGMIEAHVIWTGASWKANYDAHRQGKATIVPWVDRDHRLIALSLENNAEET